MTDIVERLRFCGDHVRAPPDLVKEAADEIERLREERDLMRRTGISLHEENRRLRHAEWPDP